MGTEKTPKDVKKASGMKTWRMILSLEASEEEAIGTGLDLIYPWERFSTASWEDPDSAERNAELYLDVGADSEAGAVAEATRLFLEARVAAGLPDAPARILGYNIPETVGESLDQTNWNRANACMIDGRYPEAVVVVQTSCEVLAATTLIDFAAERDLGWLVDLYRGRPVSLNDRTTQTIYNGLTDLRIQDQGWWPEYKTHLQRRHAIVHEGATVDWAGATASIEAASAFRTFLLAKRP